MNSHVSITSRYLCRITQLRIVAVGVVLLCAAGRAQAETTWHVSPWGDDSWSGARPECVAPDGPKAHIQAGIDAAVDGDTVLVADGTYTGVGNKNLDFGGKAITVRSASGDPALCIIDCEYDGRGIYFGSGEGPDSVVEGVAIASGFPWGTDSYDGGGVYCGSGSGPTLVNCTLTANQAGYFDGYGGGGIYCSYGSSPTLTNCSLTENQATYGGGVYCDSGSSPTLTNCILTANRAIGLARGGGIYCGPDSRPTLTNCTLSENVAYYGEGGGVYCADSSSPTLTDCILTANLSLPIEGREDGGGGVFCGAYSSPTLTNCSVAANHAASGGGVYCSSHSRPILTNCTLTANISSNWIGGGGGGVYCGDYSRPTLINCTLTANTTSRWRGNGGGGGIYCGYFSSPTLTNCTLTANQAENSDDGGSGGTGGGLYCADSSSPTLTNCTLNANQAIDGYRAGGSGGGVYCGAASSVTLTNCVFWNDAPNEIGGETAAITFSDVQGGYPGVGNIDADPRFFDPGGNDFRLRPDSPCIDAGNNDAVPPDALDLDADGDITEPTPFDRGGLFRFRDTLGAPDTGQGTPPLVDMGAHEFQDTPPPVGDVNGDGHVGLTDLALLLAAYGACDGQMAFNPDADLDSSGCIDLVDLSTLLAHFGE